VAWQCRNPWAFRKPVVSLPAARPRSRSCLDSSLLRLQQVVPEVRSSNDDGQATAAQAASREQAVLAAAASATASSSNEDIPT